MDTCWPLFELKSNWLNRVSWKPFWILGILSESLNQIYMRPIKFQLESQYLLLHAKIGVSKTEILGCAILDHQRGSKEGWFIC